MIFGKLIKPCKICLYEQKEDGGEIESFSLLKLSLHELAELLKLTSETNVEYTLDGAVVVKYSGNDAIHKRWKDIAVEHSKRSPQDFVDVSAQFKSQIPGTSVLIRDPKKHIIRIAKRDGNDENTINRICIGNDIREKFFSDSKLCTMFKTLGKYAIDTRDLDTYKFWSKYMNSSFIFQYKESKAKK